MLDKVSERIFNALKPKLGPKLSSDWASYISALGENSKLEKLLMVTVSKLPSMSEEEIKSFSDTGTGKEESRKIVNRFFGVSGA